MSGVPHPGRRRIDSTCALTGSGDERLNHSRPFARHAALPAVPAVPRGRLSTHLTAARSNRLEHGNDGIVFGVHWTDSTKVRGACHTGELCPPALMVSMRASRGFFLVGLRIRLALQRHTVRESLLAQELREPPSKDLDVGLTVTERCSKLSGRLHLVRLTLKVGDRDTVHNDLAIEILLFFLAAAGNCQPLGNLPSSPISPCTGPSSEG